MTPLFLPAPPFRDIDLGPLTIHMYSLTMITAMLLSWWWTGRRIAARGGNRDDWDGMALVAIIFGIIGARAYHVITEHARYFGPGLDPWNALKIWNGGLGVIGSIIGGGLAVLIYCRVKHVNFAGIADCIAPTLLAAQAWGRVGNWFNQEAFGRPTTLPWALKVDPQYRPLGYQQYATFHPTFLYEGLWNVIGILVLIFILERRFHLGKGKLFVSYVLWYTFGRFFIELIRIDPVDKVDGVRINDWTSGAIFIGALIVMALLVKFRPGPEPHPFGLPPVESPDEGADQAAGDAADEAAGDVVDQTEAVEGDASSPAVPASAGDSGESTQVSDQPPAPEPAAPRRRAALEDLGEGEARAD